MKNQLGIKALTLISLCMFAWSGWIYAENPKIGDAWKREDPGRIWTVTDKGGHMEVGDMFSIDQLSANGPIKLVPDPDLKDRWNPEIEDVDLHLKGTVGGKKFLCGFVYVNTDEHQPGDEGHTPFGHGKWHGVLIKVKKKNKIMIVWPAGNLGSGSRPNPEQCEQLEISSRDNHGGMAHAKG